MAFECHSSLHRTQWSLQLLCHRHLPPVRSTDRRSLSPIVTLFRISSHSDGSSCLRGSDALFTERLSTTAADDLASATIVGSLSGALFAHGGHTIGTVDVRSAAPTALLHGAQSSANRPFSIPTVNLNCARVRVFFHFFSLVFSSSCFSCKILLLYID